MKSVKYLLLFTVLACLIIACKNDQQGEATEIAPSLSMEELQEIATTHIAAELASFGNPEMTGFDVRDTMFMAEHYKREIIIYNRGLADKDRRLNMARKLMNDAAALLAEEPSNEQAKADKVVGERKIKQIEENVRIVDSLTQKLSSISEQEILYYEVLLSFAEVEAKSDGKPMNFMIQIAPDKSILKYSRTRRSAGGKK